MATYTRKLKDASGNYVVPATRASCVYMDNGITLNDFIEKLYPVGFIYQSTENTSPASLFGGEWEIIQNRFLLGSGTYSPMDIGGEANHTLATSEIPSHTHGSKSLIGSFWNIAYQDKNWLGGSCNGIVSKRASSENVGYGPTDSVSNDYDGFTINATHEHSSVGGNQPHNNMPPYFTVNIWRRVS